MIEHSTHLIVLTKVNMLDELGLRMIEIQWDEFGHLIQLVERKTFEEIVVECVSLVCIDKSERNG